MITKELLSLVLGLDVMAIVGEQGGELIYWFDDSCGNLISRESKINLDSLGRLAKEWCLDKDYVLHSFTDHCGTGFCSVSSGVFGTNNRKADSATTELEAIIKLLSMLLTRKVYYARARR